MSVGRPSVPLSPGAPPMLGRGAAFDPNDQPVCELDPGPAVDGSASSNALSAKAPLPPNDISSPNDMPNDEPKASPLF